MLGYGQQAGGTHPTGMHTCYRPQQSCEGYVFTGVCLSTGGVPDQVHPLGADHCPGSRPPWSRHPPDQVHPPRSRHPPDQVHPHPRTRYTPHPPPRDTATAADGTHPRLSNAKFPPITALLNRSSYHKSATGSLPNYMGTPPNLITCPPPTVSGCATAVIANILQF